VIPLVLLDLDGTVIGEDGVVQECVWQAIEKVRAAGVKVAVCTGRPCGGVAQRVAQRMGPNNPHIFQSGAVVAYPNGEAVQVFALKESNARKLIEYARTRNLLLELYSPNELFVERRTPMSEAHAKMIGVTAVVRDLYDVVENEPVVRAQWVVTQAQLDEVLSLALEGVMYSRATSPAMKGAHFVSVTQSNVSKGTATKYLAEALKVKLENVMGVGDSEGDLPMLDVIGHPVIMANASDALKKQFDTVTGHVEECGVVAALEAALKLKPV
jgi:Cof subfamily protein (haloacid dehalogenase superfamily)